MKVPGGRESRTNRRGKGDGGRSSNRSSNSKTNSGEGGGAQDGIAKINIGQQSRVYDIGLDNRRRPKWREPASEVERYQWWGDCESENVESISTTLSSPFPLHSDMAWQCIKWWIPPVPFFFLP